MHTVLERYGSELTLASYPAHRRVTVLVNGMFPRSLDPLAIIGREGIKILRVGGEL